MSTRHSSRGVALLVTALVVLGTLPGLAAADTRTGDSILVAEGQTVNGIEAFGGSVLVRGTVNGDLTAFGGDVTIAPTGQVNGNVQTAGANVEIAGTVGGNVRAAAGDLTIGERASIAGNVEAGAGTIQIDGAVHGDVTVGAETIRLGPAASISGDLTYDGRLRGNRDAVAGSVIRDASIGGPFSIHTDLLPFSGGAFDVYGFFVSLTLGAILLLGFPGFSRRVADFGIEAPVRAGGVGLLTLVAVPAVLLAVALTIIGIPLTLIGAVLFAVMAWVGAIYGRVAVGTWLVKRTESESPMAALAVGFVVVAVAVRIPGAGWLVEALVFLLGLGALVLGVNEWRVARKERADSEDVGREDVRPA